MWDSVYWAKIYAYIDVWVIAVDSLTWIPIWEGYSINIEELMNTSCEKYSENGVMDTAIRYLSGAILSTIVAKGRKRSSAVNPEQ
jgi:hypothetical protein